MVDALCKQNRRAAPAPLEKSITASILCYLNSISGCYAVKTRGDYRQGGQPDVIGCYRGRALALEVKRPGGRATPLQQTVLEKWRQAGAIAEVVTSKKDVERLLAVSKMLEVLAKYQMTETKD